MGTGLDVLPERLVRLVDDLLEVSRISRGAIELRKESMDLASVIESAVETSRQLIDARNIELRVDFPKEPLQLDADPVRVTQIIANLLHNSAKYTDPGGRISIRAERRGDEAIVTVADTGLGIPAEMLPRVFDLFTQVDRTLGRAQGAPGRDLVDRSPAGETGARAGVERADLDSGAFDHRIWNSRFAAKITGERQNAIDTS